MGADAGWHADPMGRAQYRWWDGTQWTDHVADGGVTRTDPLAGGAGVVAAEAGAPASGETAPIQHENAASARPHAAQVASSVAPVAQAARMAAAGGAGWQVVVGPTLPAFGALGAASGRGGLGRVLRQPAVLLAVTTVLAVVPALTTDTAGAGVAALPRLAVGLVAAAGAALVPRLTGRARHVATLLPLAFVGLQVWAMVSTWGSMADGDSGLGAAGPHLLSGAVTAFVALRTVRTLRRHP